MLGFWFADGYMSIEKSYRVVIVCGDKSILRQIRSAFSSSHPLKKRKEKGSYAPTWSLSLCSKYLYEQLQSLGGTRRKSLTLRWPKVPANYLADFVRGYFDGDGSVFFVTYIRTKDKRMTRELRTNFTSGSRQFLEELMRVLNDQIDLPIKKISAYNNGS